MIGCLSPLTISRRQIYVPPDQKQEFVANIFLKQNFLPQDCSWTKYFSFFPQGEYFFELDDKSVLPGYPKLIEDVWGIPGPIDAAFTRINCQGQSYIFKVEASVFIKHYSRFFWLLNCLRDQKLKQVRRLCDQNIMWLALLSFLFPVLQGNQYWRFNNDVLDGDYPRDISVGFDGIPNDVNAAFALPTSSHLGRERAYFFKGILVGNAISMWNCIVIINATFLMCIIYELENATIKIWIMPSGNGSNVETNYTFFGNLIFSGTHLVQLSNEVNKGDGLMLHTTENPDFLIYCTSQSEMYNISVLKSNGCSACVKAALDQRRCIAMCCNFTCWTT